MKRLLTLLAVTVLGALTGCVVVPARPGRVYVAHPPLVVVARPYYYGYGYYGR